MTSASAERESNAIEVARVKAGHEVLILQTRVECLEAALNKAEQREERSVANNKDVQGMHHQQMKEIRKELCAEVEALKEEKNHLQEKLSRSEFKVKARTEEVDELTSKLTCNLAECEDLKSRLAEANTLHDEAVLRRKSVEKTLRQAESEKEAAKKEAQANKLALDEARGMHMKSLANLEASLISAVRASFCQDKPKIG